MARLRLTTLLALAAVVGLAAPAAATAKPVERDVPLYAVAVIPNDPLFGQEWGLSKVRLPDAWARGTGDGSAVVAVVDTGVDATHPDLAGNVLPGVDCVSRPGTCTREVSRDPSGHGTGVAGVIAAAGNDGTGIAGQCWGCKILPVRALDANGAGSALTVGTGIRWAADNGADVINLSLAGDETNSTLDNAIAYARGKGVIVVAAAGNQVRAGQNLTGLQYPAASPGVLSVVGTDPADAVYPWSFRGAWADVAAPGCVITDSPGARYANECGTSFASPAVAGVLALAISTFPTAPPGAIESALVATARPLVPGVVAGGRIDAAALADSVAARFSKGSAMERIAGVDRVATAVALSRRAFPTAPAVVLARADSFADALAAAPLGGKLGAPVLLTPSGALSPQVVDEIRRLGAATAVIAGGTGALSSAIESSLDALGVGWRRLAGASRYETAALIAQEVGGTSVFLASASAWPDAVAVSGLAATTRTPILLVDRDRVPEATSMVLSSLGATDVTVVGGRGVVSDAVVDALHATRVGGRDRYETSRAIAGLGVARGASVTWVATGNDWPDALTAGSASAAAGATLQLVDGSGGVPAMLVPGVTSVVAVGGEASITAAVVAALGSLLG